MRGMTRSSTIWEVDARQPRQTLTHSQSGFWFSRGRCCWAPSCPGPQRRKRLHRLKICDHPRRAPLQDSPAINPHWWFQFFGENTVKKELAGTTGCSGSYYLWDVLHNYCFRRLAVLVQDLKFLPKVTEQLSANKSSVLFVQIYSVRFLTSSPHPHSPLVSATINWIPRAWQKSPKCFWSSREESVRTTTLRRRTNPLRGKRLEIILECEELHWVLNPPETAEAGHRPAGPCALTRVHVGLNHAAAVCNTWLGSDQDGILLGRTGMNVKLYRWSF